MESARAFSTGLLTIRADRDRYLYGINTWFERRPPLEIIQTPCQETRSLMPSVFDGLVWLSRITEKRHQQDLLQVVDQGCRQRDGVRRHGHWSPRGPSAPTS